MKLQHLPPKSAQRQFACRSLTVILMSYAISFVLPALEMESAWGPSPVTRFGWQCFVMGFVGLFFGSPIWLANPVFWFGAYLLAKRQWLAVGALGLGPFILILALLAWRIDRSAEVSYLVGFYVWLASMAMLGVAGLIGLVIAKGHGKQD